MAYIFFLKKKKKKKKKKRKKERKEEEEKKKKRGRGKNQKKWRKTNLYSWAETLVRCVAPNFIPLNIIQVISCNLPLNVE